MNAIFSSPLSRTLGKTLHCLMDLMRPQQPNPHKKEMKKDITPSCKVELMKLMKEADVGK